MSDTGDFQSLSAEIKISGKIAVAGMGTQGNFLLAIKNTPDKHMILPSVLLTLIKVRPVSKVILLLS